MITINKVHLKIQELSKEHPYIRVDDLLREFTENRSAIICHLEQLRHLEFISADYYEKGIIRLTLHGRLTIPPA